MNSPRYIMNCRSIISALFVLLLLGVSSNVQAKQQMEFTARDGKIKSCPVVYPATDKFIAAQYNVAKKDCWSCPKGYERSKNPLPDKDSSCRKKNVNKKAKKSKVKVNVVGACPGKDVWKRNNKCWTCPSGTKRSMKKTADGHPICKPEKKYKYTKATKRGEAKRACPAGYIRNPDSDKKKNACMRLGLSESDQAKFRDDNQSELQQKMADAGELIALLNTFREKLKPVIDRKGIKNLTKRDLRTAGAIDIIDRGCADDYGSFTITAGGDGSYILGANASGGIAFGRVDECETGGTTGDKDWKMTWLATTNVTAGASIGGDVSLDVGFWRSRFDDLHGYAWGIVIGGAPGSVGVTASGWTGIDWLPGSKGKFLGITLGVQAGLSLEGEVNWGYTFQKQTFNNCKGVTVHAVNKTDVDVRIIDVDYHDYYKERWRSEPTPNRTILADGIKPYIWKFNLNQVDHAYTQIRIKYRKKEGDGWSDTVYRNWSGKYLCEAGKKFRVTLRNL